MNEPQFLPEEDEQQLAMHEIAKEVQWIAEQHALRCDAGIATKEDGDWIRAEFGLMDR